jgi:ABC-type transporter MlaC component
MSIEAMKLALEALEKLDKVMKRSPDTSSAITVLCRAIEQLENRRPKLDQGPDYERGFIDGMQHQMQSSVNRAVNAMSRSWVGLTDEEIDACYEEIRTKLMNTFNTKDIYRVLEAKLREKNGG